MVGRHAEKLGFTLIELLVVIAIISLLVSILLPSLQQARELAVKASCLSQLRSVGTAMHMYVQDNGIFPPCNIPIGKEDATRENVWWAQRLTEYADGYVMVCPRHTRRESETEDNYYGLYTGGTVRPRYGFNHRALGCGGYASGYSCLSKKHTATPESILMPSMLVAVSDCNVPFGNPPAIYTNNYEWARNKYFLQGDILHTNGVNVVFVDGHAEWTDFDDENYWWEDDKHWVNR